MSMEPGEIEVSVGLTFASGLHIVVVKSEWEAMNHDARKAFIDERIVTASIKFSADVVEIEPGLTVSLDIVGPDIADITPESIDTYDPKA